MNSSVFRRKLPWVIAALVVLLCFPLFLDRFYVYLTAIILLTGLCATSLNFVLGYGGVFQFHHAVFYGVGAYGTALMITKSGLSPWLGFIVGPVAAAIVGLVIGVICIRLSKLYFGMLQISLGSLVGPSSTAGTLLPGATTASTASPCPTSSLRPTVPTTLPS
jgi:branched-chain amino acid transport system permease protein